VEVEVEVEVEMEVEMMIRLLPAPLRLLVADMPDRERALRRADLRAIEL